MSTTTQILFNSPALHSLKRDQLVKLCKIHSIKASGKNVELIERLKQRALELPLHADIDEDSSTDIEIGGLVFPGGHEVPRLQMPRPSEQWEMVMEDIEEVQESSSLGTISSKGSLRTQGAAGEFGTGRSKSSAVGSSLKAIASSFGIKRAASTKSNISANGGQPSADAPVIASDQDDLTKHAIPYSQLPPSTSPPETDHFVLSAPETSAIQDPYDADSDVSMSAPVPGSPSRPGAPAPLNARLSMGRGVTTTIRLITTSSQNVHTLDAPGTPRLEPFQTTFDIDMGTPAPDASPSHRMNIWPASPDYGVGRLYPAIPLDDWPRRPALPAQLLLTRTEDVEMPGGLSTTPPAITKATPVKASESPAKATQATPKPADAPDMFSPMRPAANTSKTERAPIPRSEPFLFGSPLPRHSLSNKGFGLAAASVLEEMNRRLAEAGAMKVDKGLIEGKGPEESVQKSFGDVFGAASKALDDRSHQRTGSADRFAKAHEETFSKMDSIANHYAARRGMETSTQQASRSRKRKSEVLGVGPAPGTKRKSSAAGARVISAGMRKKMAVPGAFGNDDYDDETNDDEDPGDRRSSKRIRTTAGADVHKGMRVSIAPPSGNGEMALDDEDSKKQKERDAIRRKLDANKARRRSSRGRVSIGAKPLPVKAKTSRFGFLSSAKSIVRNVWNMGSGQSGSTKSTLPATSNIPVAKVTQVSKPSLQTKPPPPQPSEPTATVDQANRRNTNTASRTQAATSAPSGFLKPPTLTGASTKDGSVNSARTSASRARSPIPSFVGPPSVNTKGSGASSRLSVNAGTGSTTRTASRIPSVTPNSSLGTRNSLVSSSRASVSSIGTRRSVTSTQPTGTANSRLTPNGDRDGADGTNGPSVRSRTSSLLAPTASSLAKMQPSVRASTGARRITGLPAVAEQPTGQSKRSSTVSSPSSQAALGIITNSPRSPRPTRIFDQPLTTTMFSSPASNATPIQGTSFAAAGKGMMNTPSKIPKLSVPPKPKLLVTRKPRISRSRVIAKLGSQRAGGQSSLVPAAGPSARVRSSMGARKSLGGVKAGRSSAGSELLKSAVKKRARLSEHARRRSRALTNSEKPRQDDRNDTAMAVDH